MIESGLGSDSHLMLQWSNAPDRLICLTPQSLVDGSVLGDQIAFRRRVLAGGRRIMEGEKTHGLLPSQSLYFLVCGDIAPGSTLPPPGRGAAPTIMPSSL